MTEQEAEAKEPSGTYEKLHELVEGIIVDWFNSDREIAAKDLIADARGAAELILGGLREFGFSRASQPVQVEVTDDMVERLARALFARTKEGRDGFSWPLNGDHDRQRDMEMARNLLVRVLGDAALGGGE
jgi:hypothetical protein